MKKKCKVVALSTEEITQLAYSNIIHVYFDPCHLPIHHKDDYIHLYIVSDDEIKEGDYVYHSDGRDIQNKIIFVDSYICLYSVENWKDNKVIATTDPSLNLPLIPEQFVRDYCDANGIDKVMCEVNDKYSELQESVENLADCCAEHDSCSEESPYYPLYVEALREFNSCGEWVSISPLKESWNREELPIRYIIQVLKYCEDNQVYDKLSKYDDFYYKLNQWIKENV